MSKWLLKGLKTGIVTTSYPDAEESTPGVTPGLPCADENIENATAASLSERCVICLRQQDHH